MHAADRKQDVRWLQRFENYRESAHTDHETTAREIVCAVVEAYGNRFGQFEETMLKLGENADGLRLGR